MKKYFGATLILTLLCLGCGINPPCPPLNSWNCSRCYATCAEYREFRGPRVHVNGQRKWLQPGRGHQRKRPKQTTTFMTANQLTTTIPASPLLHLALWQLP